MKQYIHACTILTVLITAIAGADTAGNDTKQIETTVDHRLPTSIKPNAYKIDLVPFYPEFFKFFGNVTINITVLSPTTNISLHALHLNITESSVVIRNLTSGANVNVTGQETVSDSRHFYVIKLGEELQVNKTYEINIEYYGEHRDDMYGFYRSSYKAGNEIRWLAATQFEPTSARRAFPCFDEPHLKATFQINIAHYKNLTAISNTLLISTSNEDSQFDNRVWDVFEETVPMSTYLVAFLVSDFENITGNDKRFRTFAREEFIKYANYSLNIGSNILNFFENYTSLNYALEKVDQVALPDFSAGAMENWGLVTYRETAVLFDEKTSTAADKQRVASVIAHELAHQWFGNLVTLHWWRYTWLNEGFARYFQYFATGTIEPTWNMEYQFIVEQVQSAFAVDGLINTQSLNSESSTPAEITAKFGTISYNKGASVLNMIKHVVTEETFQKGLQRYLNQRQFDTATPVHLYSALQFHAEQTKVIESSLGTIESLFEKWFSQPGYPVITVNRNYEQNSTVVSQSRFLLVPSLQVITEKWSIPLTWTRQNSSGRFQTTTPMTWIKDSESNINISNIATADEWVIFNNQETGFYRVNYDTKNWNKIISFLQNANYDDIHVLNRAQLLDDSLNMARAGLLSYETALEMTHYLAKETDYIPWYSAFMAFRYLKTMLFGTNAFSLFQTYLLNLMEKSYNSLGFEESSNDTQLTLLHRVNVYSWACTFGHLECILQATQLFQNWTTKDNPDNNNTISPNLRSIVYCTAVAHGGEEEWQFLWNRYINAKSASEQALILTTLGCTKNTTILNNFLTKSITPGSGIRKQDAANVFNAVRSNLNGTEVALNFLVSHFAEILENYGGMNAVGNSITGIASQLSQEAQVNLLNQFITENEALLDNVASASKNAVESARGNLQWKSKNYDTIEKWLREHTTTEKSAARTYHSQYLPIIALALIIICKFV